MQIVFVVSEVFTDESASTKFFVQGVSRTPNAFIQVLPGNCDMATALRACREAGRVWFEGVGPLLLELIASGIDLCDSVQGVILRASSASIHRLPLPTAWGLLTNIIVPTMSDVAYVGQQSSVPHHRSLVSLDSMGDSDTNPMIRYNAMGEILSSSGGDRSTAQWQEWLDSGADREGPTPGLAVTNGPLVTAAIFAHNEEKAIGAAIASLRNQTYQDLEILVIDDGSTDNTPKVIEQHTQDPRVRFIRQENMGIPRTRNRAIELARGEYIAWLGADDESLPRRIELEVQPAQGGADIVHTDSFFMTPQGRLKEVRRYRSVTCQNLPGRLLCGYSRICPVLDTSLLVRRDLYRRIGGFNEEFSRGADPEFFIRCAEAGDVKFAHIPEPLVKVEQSRPPADLERMRERVLALNYNMACRLIKFFGPQRLSDPVSICLQQDPRLGVGRALLALAITYQAPAGHPILADTLNFLQPVLASPNPADVAEVHNLLGLQHHYLRQHQQAMTCYQSALRMAPQDSQKQVAATNLQALQANQFAGVGLRT